MKKLELKYLAPYLPYGLKWYQKRMDSEPTEHLTMTAVQIDKELSLGIDVQFEDDGWLGENESEGSLFIEGATSWTKPILRPLSDLVNNEYENRIAYPIDHSFLIEKDRLDVIGFRTSESWIDITKWMPFYESLFENHFDVFQLIPDGLAIDINKLNHDQ